MDIKHTKRNFEMNLMQLKYFNAVCTYGTVSGAADYLHIAQPSLSNSIKELENEFGVMLFKRHRRGMVLTDEGETFLKMCRDILDRADRTEKIMKDMGRGRKTLKLGVPPMTGSLIMPTIYGDFFAHNRDISLETVECGWKEMNRMILEDSLDMAFISHNQFIDPNLSSMLIGRLEIVCGTTEKNELSKYSSVTPSDLKNVPLVLFDDGFFQTSEIKKWFNKGETVPEILMQTSQLSTMLSIISEGTAVGFAFRKLVEKNANIVSVPLVSPVEVDISLVWKKDKYFFSGMQRFKEFLSHRKLFN